MTNDATFQYKYDGPQLLIPCFSNIADGSRYGALGSHGFFFHFSFKFQYISSLHAPNF
jgi:hypothetical protein